MADPLLQDTPQARGRGRPLSADLRHRILAAALEIVADRGFSALTLNGLCARAGVTKAAFYRRWTSPIEVAMEALRALPGNILLEGSGNIVADLYAFMAKLATYYSDPVWRAWDSFRLMDPGAASAIITELTADGLARRARNTQALELALSGQGVETALEPGLVLNVLNGVARNMAHLNWPASEPQITALIRRLLGLPNKFEPD